MTWSPREKPQNWDVLGDRSKVGWMFGPTSGRMNELQIDIDWVTCFGGTWFWSKQFCVGDRDCYARLLTFCAFPTVFNAQNM